MTFFVNSVVVSAVILSHFQPMKLSRPAVLVLVVIWAVVLLAQPLNRLFRVQLRGSDTFVFSALPAAHNIPNFWEKAARRFPDDVNVLMQAAQEDPFAGSDAEHPSERSQVFPEKVQTNSYQGVLWRLDWLMQKYPRNATLLALRLNKTFSNMRHGRIGGEMSDADLARNQAAGIPSPERSKEKPDYSQADLQRAIALSTRGQQLEPDNGYFDWMKCCFLMFAWRDAEAFDALDAAARKKRFDDHYLDIQQSQLDALSTVRGRKLLTEEKVTTLYSYAFPQFARDREMARILSWQSVKAQRRGDHAQALRITAGLARTAARMRENAGTYIAGLVAAAIEAIGWGGPTYDARQRFGQRFSAIQRVSSFGDYAKKYGRPELAAEAARSSAAALAFRNAVSKRSSGNIFGLTFGVYLTAALLWLAGVALLLLLPIALLLQIVMWLLRCVRHMREVIRHRDSAPDEIPTSREVWNGALAFGGLRAVGTLLGGGVTIGLCTGALMVGIGQSEELLKAVTTFWSDVVTSSGSYSNIEGIYFLLTSSNELPSQCRFVVALSPLLLGTLFVAWRAIEWQKRKNGESGFRTGAFFKALFTGRVFQTDVTPYEREELDIGGGVLRLLNFVFTFLLIVAWIILAFAQSSDGSIAWLLPLFFVLLFGATLLFENFTDWRKRLHRRATMRYGLRLLQRSSFAWLILGSALYFVLLLVSVPIRNHMDARVDHAIALGEVRASR